MPNEWMEALCREAGLGLPLREPKPVSGGLMHRMFDVETTTGRYAVKRLNPEVMARPDALENLRRAAKLEAMLEQRGLPILPAITVNGEKLLRAGSEWCCIFPWFEGGMIRGQAVTARHAAAIGMALAGIHAAAEREAPAAWEPFHADWDALLAACPSLLPYGDLLKRLTDRSNEARLRLPRRQRICHNDLDTKNVLWKDETFRVIDLECLDWGFAEEELLETALYWSGLEEHRLSGERFSALVGAYRDAGGAIPPNWDIWVESSQSRLAWLAYVLFQGRAEEASETMERILCVQTAREHQFFNIGGEAWTS